MTGPLSLVKMTRVLRARFRRSSALSISPIHQSAYETRMGHAGNVRIVGRKVQEKRLLFVRVDERDCLARKDISHVFVLPQGASSAGHIADAADSIDDRLVMTMAWVELQQFGMILAGGPIADRVAVAHADGIGWIGPDGAAILDVDRGHAIARRSHDEGVVE